jgi:hypothetical protein
MGDPSVARAVHATRRFWGELVPKPGGQQARRRHLEYAPAVELLAAIIRYQ